MSVIHAQRSTLNHNEFSISRFIQRDRSVGNIYYRIADVVRDPNTLTLSWKFCRVDEAIDDLELEQARTAVSKLPIRPLDVKDFVSLVYTDEALK